MASLTPKTALGGTIPFDETIGGNRIREVSEAAMASLAMLKGQGAAFKKAAASRLGELPAPGHAVGHAAGHNSCLLYTSPSPRDSIASRMPSSA